MKNARTRLVVLAALLALPACATKRYDVSAIGQPDASRPRGARATFTVSGLDVAVESTDRVELPKGAAPASHPLTLRVCFRPKELGWSFDPRAVVLRRAGEELRPAPGAGGRVWIQPGTCVSVRFEVSIDESPGQQLVILGLARGRMPVPPVTLPIARRRIEDRQMTKGGVDALTLPLKILLFPLAMYGGG